MAQSVVLYSLATLTTLLLLGAAFALGSWRAGSRSTRSRKSPAEAPTTPSDARFAKVEAEMAELFSILEKLTTTVKRISSRQGMRDLRAGPDVPPPGTPKSKLREYYGIAGLSGPEQAKLQLVKQRHDGEN